MFLVLTTYQKPLEDIEKWLPAHSEHLDKYYSQGKIIFSGRLNPRIGGIILFCSDSRTEVEKIIAVDPFHLNGCAKYELTEFIPTKFHKDFAPFVNG